MSSAGVWPYYAEREFHHIVARPHDVRGSHDIEVIIEHRQDMVGTQIDVLDVLADDGVADRRAETHTAVRGIEAEQMLEVVRQLTGCKWSN
jgi:hypothetical protein